MKCAYFVHLLICSSCLLKSTTVYGVAFLSRSPFSCHIELWHLPWGQVTSLPPELYNPCRISLSIYCLSRWEWMAHRLTLSPMPQHPSTGSANPQQEGTQPSLGISLPSPRLERWMCGNLGCVWTVACRRHFQRPLQGNGCFSHFNNFCCIIFFCSCFVLLHTQLLQKLLLRALTTEKL